MRIGVVCPYDLGRHGGVQDQARRLVGWLSAAGHAAVLVGPGREGPAGAILLGPTLTVPLNRSRVPFGVDPRVGRRLEEVLGDAHVVHVHEPLVPTVGHAALRLAGPAKVATFHADPPAAVRAAYRALAPLHRRLLRRAAVVTAVSPVAAAAARLIRPECRIVPNGIDLDELATGPKEPGRILFVGRDDRRKGLSVLLAAWPAIREENPRASLVVLGADRPDVLPGVRFLGPVSEERKREELAAAEVLCAPNLGGESFGVVVLEGMGAGCAVVASALPAFAHVLGDTGELVAPGDPVGLADRVVALLGDRERLAALGTAARERARRFDGAVVAAAYLTAYRDALTAERP